MRIKCKEGVYGNITIKRGENPEETAARFGREYNLDDLAVNRLTEQIKDRCEMIYKLRDNERIVPDKQQQKTELDEALGEVPESEAESEDILEFRTIKLKSSASKISISGKTKKDIVSSIYKLENYKNHISVSSDCEKREEDAYNNAKSKRNWSEGGLKSSQSPLQAEGLQSRLQSPSSSQKYSQPQFDKNHCNSPIKSYSPTKKLQAQASSRMHDYGKKSEDRKVYLRNKFNEERKEAVERTSFR